MSALSEVDLRDFEKINVDVLEATLEDARADINCEYNLPFDIQEYCDTIRRIQKKLIQQTPALFKPVKLCDNFGRCNCSTNCLQKS